MSLGITLRGISPTQSKPTPKTVGGIRLTGDGIDLALTLGVSRRKDASSNSLENAERLAELRETSESKSGEKKKEAEGAVMASEATGLTQVEARLEKLEQQNRRLKFVGIVVVLFAVAGLLMGQALPRSRTIEAEEIVLRDSAGTPRAVWSLKPDGAPTLAFFDPTGKARAWLGVKAGGSPYLLFADQGGKPRAGLTVKDDGSPDLTLIDLAGNPRALLQVPSDGQAGLALYDHLGRARLGVSVSRSGLPDVRLLDKDGKVVWKAP